MLHPIKRLRDATTRPIETVRLMNEGVLAHALRKLQDLSYMPDGVEGLDSLVSFVQVVADLWDHDYDLYVAIRKLQDANYGQHTQVIHDLEAVRRIVKLMNGVFLAGEKTRRPGEPLGPERIILRVPEAMTVAQIRDTASCEPERLQFALRLIRQVHLREVEPLVESIRHVMFAAQPRPLNFRPEFRPAIRN